jgi:GT2 family glycosyltransferase
MEKWPSVSVIIVNFNGRELLKKCLESVLKSDYPLDKLEVILVDNGSTDGSVEFVKQSFPKVKIIPLSKNYGFAYANNIGFKKSNGDLILLLNNDAYLQRNTLKIMVKEIEKIKNCGVLQPKILLTKNRGLDACGAFFTNTGFLYHYGLYENPENPVFDREIPVFSVKGACMLIKREVIEKVGLFDNDFFAYFEESDFCYRAWIAGYSVYYTPKAIVYHEMGATTERLGQGKVPSWIQFHSYKNRICSYIKNLGTKELLKILPFHLFLVLFLSILYLFKREVEMSKALLQAILWNVTNLRRTLIKRRYIQRKLRVTEDKEIMKWIKRNPPFIYYFKLVQLM